MKKKIPVTPKKKEEPVVEERKKPERNMEVPAKLGTLTFKKNKDGSSYDVFDAEKAIVANLGMPKMMGNGMFLPTFSVWKDDKLHECYASVDQALEYIKKAFDKTPGKKRRK